jgi:hypothetical protein
MYSDWINHIRDRNLFHWHENPKFEIQEKNMFEASHLWVNTECTKGDFLELKYYNEDTQLLPHSKNIKKETASSISLSWNTETTYGEPIKLLDIGYHPKRMTFYKLTRYWQDDHLHTRDLKTPAIQAKEVHVKWTPRTECQLQGITYRPGPIEITLQDYKEYWRNGKFIRHEWGYVFVDWNIGLNTVGYPDWKIMSYLKMVEAEGESLLSLLLSLEKPVTLFSNKFFHSISDEFRFMNITS